MSEKIEKLLEGIQKLTLLEASELVKALEDKFGVSAGAAAVAVSGPAGSAEEETEEQTEFSIVLTAIGPNKISTIKVVREVTSLGLKEAKDLVDGAPNPVKEGIAKDEAEEIKKKFEAAGATVELK